MWPDGKAFLKQMRSSSNLLVFTAIMRTEMWLIRRLKEVFRRVCGGMQLFHTFSKGEVGLEIETIFLLRNKVPEYV
jgi:hypothetical protein